MKFPDEYFPVKEENKQDFLDKVSNGKILSKDLSVLFCAACKDVANVVEKSISFCHDVGQHFTDYKIFMYENNSTDNTVEVIKALGDSKVILQSEFIDTASYSRSSVTDERRCSLIANARNKYVDYINTTNSYDYIFIFDTDIEGGWSLNGIFNSIHYLEKNNNMGCMTSYCVLASERGGDLEDFHPADWLMFDSFAFRQLNKEWDFPKYSLALHNYIKVENGTLPIKVNSNFNGLGIYKTECFVDNHYSINNYGLDLHTDSEHIPFHKRVWDKGLEVLINPSLLTSISNHKYSR